MGIYFLAKWRPAAILDVAGSKNWYHRKLPHAHMKFDKDILNGGRVVAIYVFSRWRTAAILDFVGGKIWGHQRSWPTGIYLHTKFW